MEEVEFIPTKFGNQSAVYRGYRYGCRRTGDNGNKYWVCIRRDVTCKSTLITSKDRCFVKWSGYHVHPPDVAQCEVLKTVSVMKKRAREESPTPVQQIYNAEASKLIDRGLDLVTNIPRHISNGYCSQWRLHRDRGW